MVAVALAAGLTACSSAPAPVAGTPSAVNAAAPINPARVERSRAALPDGYEITAYQGPAAPVALWGMRVPAVTEPPQCAALAAPAADPSSARGWSGSGPGGIAYAVVAGLPAGSPVLPHDCGSWTVSAGPTTAAVVAETFIAGLGDYLCLVSLVTDPGSPHPALAPDFAAHLLTETVAALRG